MRKTRASILLIATCILTIGCNQEVTEIFPCTENAKASFVKNGEEQCGTATLAFYNASSSGNVEEIKIQIVYESGGSHEVLIRKPLMILEGDEYIHEEGADVLLALSANNLTRISNGKLTVLKMDRGSKLLSFTFEMFGSDRQKHFRDISGSVTDLPFD